MVKQNKHGRKVYAAALTAAMAASAIVPVAVSANQVSFPDVEEGKYYTDAINYLANEGIVQGDENGNFNPTNNITRAAVAEILYKALELPAGPTTGFTDVENKWYKDAINAVVADGVFQGTDNNLFSPDAEITRAEVAKVIVDGFDLEGEADLSSFPDEGDIKAWAKEDNDGNPKNYFAIAVENGIITGKELVQGDPALLAPNDMITRAELATMVDRTINLDLGLGVEDVSAINETTVDVEFEALTEAMADVTVEVKDSVGTVREVVAQDLAVGATSAQFDFVTPVATADLVGVWTVDGKNYSFDELELVQEIVTESATPVNEVALLNLLDDADIQNVDPTFASDYANTIDTVSPAPVWASDIQGLIDEVNDDMADAADEAVAVKAVVDATTQVQLNTALQVNFDRVNAAWIIDYTAENVSTQGPMLALSATNSNYFGDTNGVTMADIQAAIDIVNDAAIVTEDGSAATAAEQANVTTLIEDWVEVDDSTTPLVTPKADEIKASKAKEAAYKVAQATTKNSLYNALVGYADATVDSNLKVSELNSDLKVEYLTALNTGTVRTTLVSDITSDTLATIDLASGALVNDIKTDIVGVGETAALSGALATIDGLTAANTPTQVKTSLQKLADVTSHKTGAGNKFDMVTVIESKLMDYVTVATDGFATQTINSVALVDTAISTVNDSISESDRLAAVNVASTATQMRTALTAVAAKDLGTYADYINNLSAQGKLEVAELVLNDRDTQAGAEFANTAAVDTAVGNSTSGAVELRAVFIGDVNTNAAIDTTTLMAILDDATLFPEFEALSGSDQIGAAQDVEAEFDRLQLLAPAQTFTTIKQIKTAAGL